MQNYKSVQLKAKCEHLKAKQSVIDKGKCRHDRKFSDTECVFIGYGHERTLVPYLHQNTQLLQDLYFLLAHYSHFIKYFQSKFIINKLGILSKNKQQTIKQTLCNAIFKLFKITILINTVIR